MCVYFLAQLTAALIEREIRNGMVSRGVSEVQILPEQRPSRHPTAEQVFRVFEPRARHLLHSEDGKPIQTFGPPDSDPEADVEVPRYPVVGLRLSHGSQVRGKSCLTRLRNVGLIGKYFSFPSSDIYGLI